jgi:hypothetical protein
MTDPDEELSVEELFHRVRSELQPHTSQLIRPADDGI